MGFTLKQDTILVADDCPDMVRMIAKHLAAAGYHVLEARDGAEALEIARKELPALVVLDLKMPHLSGIEVLKALKAAPATAPISVFMLTAHGDEVDRILSFELGADDYLSKPFSPRELVLRVRGIVSRNRKPAASGQFRSGTVLLDTDRHEVFLRNKTLDVTATEFRILSTLLRKAGRVFTRDELVDEIWGPESEVDPRNVDTHLRRLRAKMGEDADVIQTIRGVGYRVIAD